MSQPDQQVGPPLQAFDWVLWRDPQALRHGRRSQRLETSGIDLERLLRLAAKDTSLEHLQAGDGEALAASVAPAVLLARVRPLCAGAGVEEHGDEEEVDQAARLLLGVDLVEPRCDQYRHPLGATHVKVLPTAVWRDVVVIWSKIAL
jgi:hypothetical protein